MNSTQKILARKDNVVRLCDRRSFLQILLPGFTLIKEPAGLLIDINVQGDSLSIVDMSGKKDLNTALDERRDILVEKFQKEYDEFQSKSGILAYRFDCAEFPFRYANGGVLPIVHLDSRDYFCLFYREIHPIGWNIANGASDNLEELLDPGRTVLREFGEELLFCDTDRCVIYAFDPGEGNRPPGFQKDAVAEWSRILKADLENFEGRPLPLKWMEGPDRVRAFVEKKECTTGGYFLSITPEDNAIEVDRIAHTNLTGDVCLLDGEMLEGTVLDRIIGLFEVEAFEKKFRQEGRRDFIPDLYFHQGKRWEPDHLDESIEEYLDRLVKLNIRDSLDEEGFSNEKSLCPIARSVIDRYFQWLEGKPVRIDTPDPVENPITEADQAEIFLCHKSENHHIVRWLHKFLTDRNYRVFFSEESIKRQGASDYMSTIIAGLSSATCLIVTGRHPGHFLSGYVKYEWSTFLNEILSKRKKGELFTFAHNVDVADLPLELRDRHMIPLDPSSPESSFENLLDHIRGVLPPR